MAIDRRGNFGGGLPYSKMIVRRVGWNHVVDHLKETFCDDEKYLKDEVLRGVSQCWIVGDVYAITRKEDDELVVPCLAGKNAIAAAKVIKQAAINSGFKTIRFHTQRAALGRLLKPLGVELEEYVFKARLYEFSKSK